VSRDDVEHFATGLGDGLYRAKGIVFLAMDPRRRYVYQQVGPRWSLEPGLPWGADVPKTRLVVIGRKYATTSAALADLLGGSESYRATRRPSTVSPTPRPHAARAS
jgi:G3E family GTPase